MKRKYEQSYRSEWEQEDTFKTWLSKTKNGDNAYCKVCNCNILPRIASLKEHLATAKHQRNFIGFAGSSQIDKLFKKSSISHEVKSAEIKFVATLIEHNIPFRAMDHISDVINQIFHDSEIAKRFSCKRTKSAAIAYNVLGKQCESDLLEEIHTCQKFSIIIDETTDVSTTKTLAVAVKFFPDNALSIKTKFLCLIDINHEKAQDIFEAIDKALSDYGFNFSSLIGFAADTTNVMFGEQGGIVAKIKDLNPNCVFVKCVCHLCALAVSYACKILPRNLEQLIKEVHNYFAHSSKRQREFEEFQNFTESEQHKILRHFDIRWLSFHTCINRILEQWNALKLYFTNQYLGDKRQNVSCDIYSMLSMIKLLDFICTFWTIFWVS